MSHVKISILVVEDNLQDYIIFKEILGQIRDFFIYVEHAQDLESAMNLAKAQRFDIVFLDLFLPDSFGQETFTRFQAEDREVPVVILSGLSDKNIALEIVKLGAQDYIVKGEFDSNLLEKSIVYSIERKKYQDRLRISEQKYRSTFQAVGVAIAEYDYTELKAHLDELRASGVKDILKEINLTSHNMARYRGMMKTNNVNPETLRLYECESAEEFTNNSIKFYTEETVSHIQHLVKVVWDNDEYYEGEAIFRTATGRRIVTLKRVVVLGADLGYHRMIISTVDVTRLKQQEYQVIKQAEILQGISDSAVHLLEESDHDVAFSKALRDCGLAFGVDRVSLYQFFPKADDTYYNLTHYWDVDGIDYKSVAPEFIVSGKMKESPLLRYAEQLARGEIAEIYNDELDDEEKDILSRVNEESILAIPILSEDELMGALMLKLSNHSSKWTDLQKSGASTVARNIGSALSTFKAKTDLEALNQNLEQVVRDRTAKMEEAIKELESLMI
jgi:DNA-binding response OmpR family regulator